MLLPRRRWKPARGASATSLHIRRRRGILLKLTPPTAGATSVANGGNLLTYGNYDIVGPWLHRHGLAALAVRLTLTAAVANGRPYLRRRGISVLALNCRGANECRGSFWG